MAQMIISNPAPGNNPIIYPNAASWRNQDARHCCACCRNLFGSSKTTGLYCAALAEAMQDKGLPVERVRIEQDCSGICDCYECDETVFYKEFGQYPGELDDPDTFNGTRRGTDYPASLGR